MAVERSAGAVVYHITEEGTLLYLLLQPAVGKPWGFPKGKIDPGENDEQAARREIFEEAGLDHIEFAPAFLHVVHYAFRRGRTVVHKDVAYFLARVDTTAVTISWEHVAYQWVTIAAAMDLVVFDNTRETLRKADRHLAEHGVITS